MIPINAILVVLTGLHHHQLLLIRALVGKICVRQRQNLVKELEVVQSQQVVSVM